MANYNKWIGLGYLTRDPETRFSQGGMQITSFGLAVNRKTKGEDKVLFIDCAAFGKTAEVIAEYCKKGNQLLVEGHLELQTWEKDGEKRSKIAVIVEMIQLMPSKQPVG